MEIFCDSKIAPPKCKDLLDWERAAHIFGAGAIHHEAMVPNLKYRRLPHIAERPFVARLLC
jgi:hypothetical protein